MDCTATFPRPRERTGDASTQGDHALEKPVALTGESRSLDGWMMFMRPLSIIITIVAALLGHAVAVAQTWPSRPITIVVPFPPGPALDLVARQVGAGIAGPLGQTVVI